MDARRQIKTTKVDDGRFGKVLAIGDYAARVERRQDVGLRHMARRRNRRTGIAAARPDQVVAVAADAFVQAHESLGRDAAACQRLQAILHSVVVVWQLRFGISVRVDEPAPLVNLNVVDRTAHAFRA